MQQGKLAIQIANPGQNNQYRPSGMPYDVGVFPLGPSGTRRGVGGGGTGWAITGPTKLPEEAWALIAMISSREGELDEVKIGQTTPSRISVATSKDYIDPTQPPKNAKAFADGQEFVMRDPLHPKWADLERDVIDKTLNDQLWTNQQPASQVMATVKAQGDPYLKS
jgi:multiple sugar transport system substrate-binding protein